jgi:alkylation response protein AidB-like acyl-CoA dehydrogenase
MDFTFSEEQKMLRASLRRFLDDRYPFKLRYAASRSARGLPDGIWSDLAKELGILGVGISERHGGFGGGPVEHMIIMEELGRALVLEPYVETIVIGAELLARSGGPKAASALEAVILGECLLAYAWAEPGMGADVSAIATTAVRNGNGWHLSGRKTVVTGAPWASHLLVTARTSGRVGDKGGISLFLIDKSHVGISLKDYPTIDGRRASDIEFVDVALPIDALLGGAGDALALLEEIADRAVAALCAEAIGIMEHLLEATMTYTKERKQFGKALTTFQVLQHRMADMLIETELATSAVYLATLELAASPNARALAASSAKVMIGAAGRFVGHNAVQLHGGMGMTDDLAIGHYFKRLLAIGTEFGDDDHHCARHNALAGDWLRP